MSLPVPMMVAATRAVDAQDRRSDRACCAFVREVLAQVYGAAVVARVPTYRWHLNPEDDGPVGPWEPVVAASDAGVAEIVEVPIDGHWHVVQGWRGIPFARGVTGHTFLWRAIERGWGYVLDSTEDRGQRLVGLTKWADYTSQFPDAAGGGVAVAALRQVARKVPRLGVPAAG